MSRLVPTISLVALALALPAAAQAQNYADLPPLTPMTQEEMRTIPADMRAAPATAVQTDETVTTVNGVETITRTRRIDARRPLPAQQPTPQHAYAPQSHAYAPQMAYAAPVVFERQQWIDECRRRTEGQDRDNTGAIIGGLLGSIFDGDDDEDRYDCEAALDSYISQYGAPGARIASREIAYPAQGYAYPAGYNYGYSYAPPPQMVLVPVRTEVQQQVVVRETERFETYTVPGAVREIPAPRPSPKMIKNR